VKASASQRDTERGGGVCYGCESRPHSVRQPQWRGCGALRVGRGAWQRMAPSRGVGGGQGLRQWRGVLVLQVRGVDAAAMQALGLDILLLASGGGCGREGGSRRRSPGCSCGGCAWWYVGGVVVAWSRWCCSSSSLLLCPVVVVVGVLHLEFVASLFVLFFLWALFVFVVPSCCIGRCHNSLLP
jgi:hypothetical protein